MHAIRNYIFNVDHMKIAVPYDVPILDMQIIKWHLISGYTTFVLGGRGQQPLLFFLLLRQYDDIFK